MHDRLVVICAVLLITVGSAAQAAPAASAAPKATEPPGLGSGQLANRRFLVRTPQGSGLALYFGNGSLEGDPRATRAIIIVHGVLRNADTYFATGEQVLAQAHTQYTLLIAPQFVEVSDLRGHAQSAQLLRWKSDWPGGAAASAPAAISTYAVFDAMLARLGDRSRFPALREVAIVGHSAGGQIVQRYAAVGRGPDTIAPSGPSVHFVVANPSSYLFFDPWRPDKVQGCHDFNVWRYGLIGAPPYVVGSPAQLEHGYAKRHVTYLLGTADTNPREWDLDTSCAAEAQGAYRFSRGKAYISYMRMRNPRGSAQDYAFVGGVGHDNRKMFTSACGLAVIFGVRRTACAASGRI